MLTYPFSPRIDLIFKRIFGVEENKDLLIALINSIVSEEDQVIDLALLNPYNARNFWAEKVSILDIKAKGLNGAYFNIEVKITSEEDYDNQALHFWAKSYIDQLRMENECKELRKIIGIHILNLFSIPASEPYFNKFHITESEMGIPYFKPLDLYVIELRKFQGAKSEVLSDLVPKIKTALDTWAAFLTRTWLFDYEALPDIPQKAELHKALMTLEVMGLTSKERENYEGKIKWFRATSSALDRAEERLREAIMKETAAKEIAKKLLANGMDFQTIASLIDLTIEDLQKIEMDEKQ